MHTGRSPAASVQHSQYLSSIVGLDRKLAAIRQTQTQKRSLALRRQWQGSLLHSAAAATAGLAVGIRALAPLLRRDALLDGVNVLAAPSPCRLVAVVALNSVAHVALTRIDENSKLFLLSAVM